MSSEPPFKRVKIQVDKGDYAGAAFELLRLDPNIRYMIMSYLSVRDIINVCQANRKLFLWCITIEKRLFRGIYDRNIRDRLGFDLNTLLKEIKEKELKIGIISIKDIVIGASIYLGMVFSETAGYSQSETLFVPHDPFSSIYGIYVRTERSDVEVTNMYTSIIFKRKEYPKFEFEFELNTGDNEIEYPQLPENVELEMTKLNESLFPTIYHEYFFDNTIVVNVDENGEISYIETSEFNILQTFDILEDTPIEQAASIISFIITLRKIGYEINNVDAHMRFLSCSICTKLVTTQCTECMLPMCELCFKESH